MTIEQGSKIGHYEIGPQLGAGGMGEVYFARDTRLGRPVALKLLMAEFTSNRDRLRRFEQEARATSALNHPNILTIYEIGESDSRHYIATEFIDGRTLRQITLRGRMHWAETLDIAIQVATALVAAHTNGIVHRDIKPENLMLRTDGYVKVLDFGLAKLTEPDRDLTASETSKPHVIHTDPGALIGTVAYMSPEQLRVQDLDGRTDIWSLGVVLYELIAGHPPFDQSTRSDLIVSILEREPKTFAEYGVEAPIELQSVVMKALHKQRDERYRTAKELLEDLKQVKQDLELNTKANLSTLIIRNRGAASTPSGSEFSRVETEKQTAQTRRIQAGIPTLSAASLIEGIKRHSKAVMLLVGLVCVAIVASVFWRRTNQHESRQMTLIKLPMTTGVREAAVSPDGKYVATVVVDGGKHSISVRQVINSSEVRIVPAAEEQYRGLVFSPDGNYVYYLKQDRNTGTLFQVPALGGTARKLIPNVDTPVSFSPNGSQLAFVRRKADVRALIIAGSDGTDAKEFLINMQTNIFGISSDLNNGPAWSPDGEVIVCPAASVGEPFQMNVVAVRISDGSVRLINSQPWYLIGEMAWLSDGSGLVMNAEDKEPPSSTFQLWLLSFKSGDARRLTNDLSFYRTVSLSEDSSTLVTTQSYQISGIWIISATEYDQSKELIATKNKGTGGLFWTPDDMIVYASAESGNQDIWRMDSNGNGARQLTFNAYADAEPVVSTDGRYIVFVSYQKGRAHIWRMNADGSDQKQLTNGTAEDSPQFSTDGRWVIYHSEENSTDSLYKVSIDGGSPSRLTTGPALGPSVSPDGKFLAFFSKNQQADGQWRITIIPFEGGTAAKTFDVSPTVCPECFGVRWSPDGRNLTYVATSAGVSNIWIQAVIGGPPQQLTQFREDQIYAFAWSPDGKQLACVRGMTAKDVVLIRDFR